MKVCLVTGGMGFIGSNFIRYLFESNLDFKVINVDKLTYAGNPENLKDIEEKHPNQYKFYKMDICDFKAVDEIILKNDVDYIINFAAESHVDRSIINPSLFCDTNISGTIKAPGRHRGSSIKRKIKGIYAGIKIGNLTATETWAFEQLLYDMRQAGRFK